MDNAPTPEHLIVARQVDAPVEHRLLTAVLPPDKIGSTAYNLIAQEAAAGWRVAGVFRRDRALTAVLSRAQAMAEGVEASVPAPLPAAARSDTTLLGEPLVAVPPALRFASDDGYVFDVDELVDLVEARGVGVNPWTGQAFSVTSWEDLLTHPSGAGNRLATMNADNAERIRSLSAETSRQLGRLAGTLAVDPTDGELDSSVLATASFREYAATLPRAEQVALASARFTLTDTHGATFVMTPLGALSGLQNAMGCSRAAARYLQAMAEQIALAAK